MEVKSRVTLEALTRLEMAREKARIKEKELATALFELKQAAEKRREGVE